LKLIDGLQSINYYKGEAILREGDEGEEFYIIEQGSCECLKLYDTKGRKGFVMVRTLKAGEHFGELALIKHEPRSLTIRAKEHCKLLKLDKETFTRILGTIEKHLKLDYAQEFDLKMKQVIQNQRTYSQTFDKNHFLEMQEVVFHDRTMVHGDNRQGLISANSSFVNFTMGSNDK
jgi:CRP-like cAMP-binding protein